jgi:hypothetical protein
LAFGLLLCSAFIDAPASTTSTLGWSGSGSSGDSTDSSGSSHFIITSLFPHGSAWDTRRVRNQNTIQLALIKSKFFVKMFVGDDLVFVLIIDDLC